MAGTAAAAVLLAASRVAVISVGTDPAAAGQIQKAVETRLVALPAIELVEAGIIADGIGVKQAGARAPADPELQAKIDGLLEGGRQGYVAGEYPSALERLAQAEALLDPSSADERVRLYLLRSAVLLKGGDRDQAAAATRSALELQPDLVVDLGVFPPSLNSLVGDVRATLPARYMIELDGIPPVARITLDGKPVPKRFAATSGRHKVVVAAAGYRTLEIALDVTRAATVEAAPPVALEKALETALFELVWAANPETKDAKPAKDLAARLGVDGVVLIASRTSPVADARAVVFWRETSDPATVSPTKPTSRTGQTALAEWIALQVGQGQPRPAPAVAGVAPSRPRKPVFRDVRGGMVVVSRRRSVRGTGGAGFGMSLLGVGPRVTADIRRGGLIGTLELGVQQYGDTKVNRPEGGSSTAVGGTGMRGRASAGYGFGSERFRISALQGLLWDEIDGKDARDSTGAALGLHPTQRWAMFHVRLEGFARVSDRFLVTAAFTFAPGIGDVAEDPKNSTGDYDGDNVNASILEAGIAWSAAERLTLGAEFAHESRVAKFNGTADAPFAPPIVDAKDTLTIDTFQVSARYRF